MNSFSGSYNKILEILHKIEKKDNFLNQIRKPKLSDKELIAMNLTAEYLSIDSEHDLFRKIPKELFMKIERSVYNRRKRRLFGYIERIREKLSNKIIPIEEFNIIDSMPVEVCKLSRCNRVKICKENIETSPNKGFCASQNMNFFGYKLHSVCTVQGVFRSFDLSAASVHDVNYLNDVKYSFSNCTIIGDKGYVGIDYQLDLFNHSQIKLQIPMKTNQKNYKPQAYILKKTRKRIETLFSQLCDQFMIRRNYAKSFDGFKTRILSKITALTVIQFINKQLNRNINNLKVNIA